VSTVARPPGANIASIRALLSYLSWDAITQYNDHIAKREREPVPPDGYTVFDPSRETERRRSRRL